ncbi:MAG TPA: archease [Nitrososphaeraceae archaeon]|nr:archease [Nitrososphaeraceae archaeon]
MANYNIDKNKFRYLDHMTDLVVEAYGSNLEELFSNSAIGVVNAMFDLKNVDATDSIQIVSEGYDFKSLLYDWIEKIILIIYIDKLIITNFNSLVFSKKYPSTTTENNKKNRQILTKEDKEHLISNDCHNSVNKTVNTEDSAIFVLEGIGIGEKINLNKHEYKVEIKSITYHEMEIKRNKKEGSYTTKFLVDL